MINVLSYLFQSTTTKVAPNLILLYGIGRSGSTILAQAIGNEGSSVDLGEILRTRRNGWTLSSLWRNDPAQIIVGYSNFLCLLRKTQIVVHVKPFHLEPFQFSDENFLMSMQKSGFKIIFLNRDKISVFRSNEIAFNRMKWHSSIDAGQSEEVNENKSLRWPPNARQIEFIKYLRSYEKRLPELQARFPEAITLGYEGYLSTERQQTATAKFLAQKWRLDVDFNKIKYRKNPRIKLSNEAIEFLERLDETFK